MTEERRPDGRPASRLDVVSISDLMLTDTSGLSFPCNDASTSNPWGMKPLSSRASQKGDWQVALDPAASYTELTIAGAGPKMAAAVADYTVTGSEVAGFLLSLPVSQPTFQQELEAIIKTLRDNFSADKGWVAVQASGTHVPSHDLYPSVQGTTLELILPLSSSLSSVRNEILATLLHKSTSQLGNLPSSFGTSDTKFILRFTLLKRYQLKLDPKLGKPLTDSAGYGIDTGDKSQWRLMLLGAVARRAAYEDPALPVGLRVEDLSNGTALARAGRGLTKGCELHICSTSSETEIIWVVDESNSMLDNRQDIVANANSLFARAVATGLDFRMGVTNVCSPYGQHASAVGKFCSVASKDDEHDGGPDRFLLPGEQATFSACVENPPGKEASEEYGLVNAQQAVKRHLPRQAGSLFHVRPKAQLAIIVVTDEVPNSLISLLGSGYSVLCSLAPSNQAVLNTALLPYIELFSGLTDPEARATMHVIGGVCNNSCSAFVAHGYRELAQKLGGQVGDVCQSNLGSTLQVMVDSIAGKVSPVKLRYVPVSASLAASLNGMSLQRSRKAGFDFWSASNALVFTNVKIEKGDRVQVGYWRFL